MLFIDYKKLPNQKYIVFLCIHYLWHEPPTVKYVSHYFFIRFTYCSVISVYLLILKFMTLLYTLLMIFSYIITSWLTDSESLVFQFYCVMFLLAILHLIHLMFWHHSMLYHFIVQFQLHILWCNYIYAASF